MAFGPVHMFTQDGVSEGIEVTVPLGSRAPWICLFPFFLRPQFDASVLNQEPGRCCPPRAQHRAGSVPGTQTTAVE